MAYISLYRKYRSQSFSELLGQEHITRVLRNSISAGRIAHAYLFCGPRGCGKTSTARLLARSLNCMAFDRPTPDPCGSCPSCIRIRDGNAMDVVEMDAASETGIDDVREKIIENARYAPAESRYKVYIIDEVHDLSQKAFDSLLKTIEEPPPHVVFVLATTEAHKVPITIRSRCQRLDFRRGATGDLTANLRRVLDAEGRPYEAEALFLLSRAAEGSFRDSLSLLEQVMAFTDGPITPDAVHQAIGAVTTEMLDTVVEAIGSDDLRAVLDAGDRVLASGADARQVLTALQNHLRDMLVVAFAGSVHGLEGATEERLETLRRQALRFTSDQLVAMLGALAQAERDIRFTNQHRLVLERALWQIMPSAISRQAAEAPAAAQSRRAVTAPTGGVAASHAPRISAPSPTVEPKSVPAPVEQAQPEPSSAAADSAPFATEVDLAVLQRIWPRVRSRVLQRSRAAAAIFGSEEVTRLDGTTVTVAFPTEFARSRADRPQARQMVESLLCEELRLPGYTVRYVVAQASPTVQEVPDQDQPGPAGSALLQQVLVEFPAAVVDDQDAQ
ncbi:MAG: DNA polymerase III subunit gamma/tau [Chthonomonadales bacterium]|nr:DNA polymerase III subunit gamma/tau [Chthonomonadales bacterium]